ncbi:MULTISPECIES: single-stranded DNA-binding protein [Anaerotruncus]|uniref:single-stranded DNA-binding protein n=1 Tax=Anaerotruncus TaxID=244127 RepID=UPI000E46E23D|nr:MULTISPECIES: single-stranded DNA-binding protein [Anaerotruncus]RGX55765.1 single-stranded DNA-binding protein [Anaerotruncus sp. AF02-27]
MLNRAILMGRLVADPELRQTPNGVSVCSFRIAVDRNYSSRGGERQADFIDIVAWRQSAEFVSKYFNKGKMIIVEGSIQTRSYEDKNGNKRTAVEVVADNVQFGESKSASSSSQSYSAPAPTQAPPEPAVSYASGDVGDFSEMAADSDDLPF